MSLSRFVGEMSNKNPEATFLPCLNLGLFMGKNCFFYIVADTYVGKEDRLQ